MASADINVATMDVRAAYEIAVGVLFINNRFNRTALTLLRGFNCWVAVPVPFALAVAKFTSVSERRELADLILRLRDLC